MRCDISRFLSKNFFNIHHVHMKFKPAIIESSMDCLAQVMRILQEIQKNASSDDGNFRVSLLPGISIKQIGK